MQTYRAHEASREAIELAFDAILQEKMKVRAKYGFRPPRTGRKTDAAGDDLVRCILAPFLSRHPSGCRLQGPERYLSTI